MKRLLCVLLTLVMILSSLSLFSCVKDNEIDLGDYFIVIPSGADATTTYSAECLSSLAKEKTGEELKIVTDSESERECEILIGETNRTASKTSAILADGQYLLFKSGDKIVMKGYGIYIGSACGDFLNKYAKITDKGLDISALPTTEQVLNYTPSDTYRSVIFMIGDGMGQTHIDMTVEKKGVAFVASSFPNQGISVTRSYSVISGEAKFTDSAASATAMATGYKTINGYIGLNKDGLPIKNVRELAHESGAKTAVVTTDLITGATPSSYMCHSISRDSTDELTTQINALTASGLINYCQGDVGNDLTMHTRQAISTVSADGSAFFVMIEEGIIDKHAHAKEADGVMDTVLRFNDAVAYATQYTLCHPDVALIVTADHETGNLVPTTPGNYYFGSYNHTNKNVPIFAIGAGASTLNGQKIENTVLAQFCAKAYSKEPFGDSTTY